MKTAVLLVYETVPDSLDLYLIPHDCDFLDTLRACHRLYINGDESPELDKLSDIMYTDAGSKKRLNEWKLPKNAKFPGDVKINEIIVTGFLL